MMDVVVITVSNIKDGKYCAYSYPQIIAVNNTGFVYDVPVYYVFMQKQTIPNNQMPQPSGFNFLQVPFTKTPSNYVEKITDPLQVLVFHALRFMPYWNDPMNPDPTYSTIGFTNSGLPQLSLRKAGLYLPDFCGGGIQLRDGFFIHKGPLNRSVKGWGAAGCVEIIGEYPVFLNYILALLGHKPVESKKIHRTMGELVRCGQLWVEVQKDVAENILKPPYSTTLYSRTQ